MNIALIGSTGLAGRYVCDDLIDNGHTVSVLLRKDNAKINSKARKILGDITNDIALRELIKDSNVVINTIGQLKNEYGFYSVNTNKILKIMNENNVNKYIGITGASLRLPTDKISLLGITGSLVMKIMYPKMIADKYKEISILQESNINWTLIRLPMVHEGSSVKEAKCSLDNIKSNTIYNKQISEFILKILTDNAYCYHLPVLYQ